MEPEAAIALARSLVKERVAARESNFLNIVRKGIFQYPRSPYQKLLEATKIRFNDLKAWVEKDGLEASLRTLKSEGIYFTVEEFKGRVPVRRNGMQFQLNERMFDNPFLSYVYEVRSGATRSAGTRVRIDFDYLHQRSFSDALLLDIHGCLTAPVANWFPVFPGAPGINSSLRFSHIGNSPRRWFSQVDENTLKIGWEKRWGKKLIYVLSRMYGRPLAGAEYVDLTQARKIAEWAKQMLDENPTCVVYTFAASATRVCIAAAEANLNIKGAKFLVTGEPLTPQKRKEIESAGASAIPIYGISEAGVVAAGCNKAFEASDECHVYKDTTAIIGHRMQAPHSDATVDSLLFTSILHQSPKLLLNVGMGDCGNLDIRACDCGFGQAGMDTHLSNIRSYEKLTGEGVTFVNTDFVWIIEKKLPEMFGGKSTDYQVVEEEGPNGLPRLRLLISPSVGTIDEAGVQSTFLRFLKHAEAQSWGEAGTQMWSQSGMIRVVRDFPMPTRSGKILPFYLLKPENTHKSVAGGSHGISNSENEKAPSEWNISAARS